ncbi:MAG: hypothetical protein D3909_09155, partial [Candidatus Electrothrix sp. ATG1]|nr:hypothetical protein [Candidatus Electrothrix sp. ATG1]
MKYLNEDCIMKTARYGRFSWGCLGLLALIGFNGCGGTTGTTGTISSGTSTKLFDASALIAAHNKWRAQVSVPGLQWSEPLARSAQSWANTLKGTCSLKP